MTTELGGKKAGGGVKSIGDKLPQGLHTKQLQRELYPQAIVRTLRYYRVMKKENLFFSLLDFSPFWGRKISTIEPDYHWLHMIWLLWEPKKVVFISINDFGCSTILPTNKMVVIMHSVWNWPKMSHSTLRAKRATFAFWVDKCYSRSAKK